MKFFDKLHPLSEFFYFAAVILLTALSANPIISGLSFIFAVLFCGFYTGVKKLFSSLSCALPLMIIIALINPIFVHKGDTILFFLNDNPVTKEAVLYGVFSSVTISAVYYWCKAYNEIITSDKFIYLFGKIAPKLSLLLSLIIGFIPKLKKKYKQIDEAQKALGVYASKSYVDKIANKFRVLSILLTDSLENSVSVADSMQARGYGLKGRTSYSPFVFTFYDGAVLLLTALTGGAAIILCAFKTADFGFYPTLTPMIFGVKECIFYACSAIVFALCSIIEIKEEIKWACLKSKI